MGDGGAGGRVGPELANPQGERGQADGVDKPSIVARLLGHGVDQHGLDPGLAEHAAQVGLDGFFVPFGNAVEHHGDCDGARGRRVEQFPGHGVGVAVGGGDEEPQIGGGKQFLGQGAVFFGDRVDIGRVDERDAARQGRRGYGHERLRNQRVGTGQALPLLHAGAGQGRQKTVGGQGGLVFGAVEQHGVAGGGSNRAGLGEGFAQQGVDQGGFAGAGGSANHDGKRAVHAGAAGQDVIVKLPGHGGD